MTSLRRILLCGAAVSAISGAALAQETTETTETVDQVATEEAAPAATGERIVVTGSRIQRDAFSSVSPIQVITAETSKLEGLVDTAEILQGSTTASGSVQFNNTFNAFVIEGGAGINSVSLRGLGAQRSLVLVNGRRPGPAGARGQVGSFDLNVIPSSIIDRVEILKDGASSVYGSDAVAGVANIITRTDISTPEIYLQYNSPEEQGGESFQISGAWGLNWESGNIVFGAEYQDRKPVKWGQRKFLSCAQDYRYDAATGERIDAEDRSVLAGTDLAGCSNVYFNAMIDAWTGTYYAPTNGPQEGPVPGYGYSDFARYDTDGEAWTEDVQNDPRYLQGYALGAVQRTSLYGKSNVDLPFGMTWNTEALYTRREYQDRSWGQMFGYYGPDGSYDTPTIYSNPFDSLAVAITLWPYNSETNVDYYYVTTGLKGDFGGAGYFDSWSWETNASYSLSDAEYVGNQINAETVGDWYTPGPNGIYEAPAYNPFTAEFLSGNWSQDVYDLLTIIDRGTTKYEQVVVDALVSGDLFELPAGPLGFALGVEHRRFEIDDTPSEASQNGQIYNYSTAQPTRGDDSVTEVFAELEVPVLKGLPGIEEFSLNGSARAFDYDSYGSDSVWKAGFNWQVIPMLRFRGTKGTSYRAPALYELYLGNQSGFQQQSSVDPCIRWGLSSNENLRANCAAAGIPDDYFPSGSGATVYTGGGLGVLEAETSEAQTLGLIFTPSFLDLSIAIDYFDISVKDTVSRLGAANIVASCYVANNYPNEYCSLFTRAPGGTNIGAYGITEIRDSYLNLNEQSTRGIDITVKYEHEFSFGDLTVDLNATHTMEDVIRLFDPNLESGFDSDDFSGTIGDPEWVGDAHFALRRGDFTYNWFVDYIGPTDNSRYYASVSSYYGRQARRINTTDDWLSHDVSLRWRGDKVSVTAGVSNVFDAQPPIISNGAGSRLGNVPQFGTQYDIRGRTFFISFGADF